MQDTLVELKQVRKEYGNLVAIHSIDLAIEKGQFVVLLGPSGSGKTTILSVLGGFVTPTSGNVTIAGQDVTFVPPSKRPTVTVFQDYALFPHMDVGNNVSFGLAMRNVAKPERIRRAGEALTLVGLEGYAKRRIHELSGGQRQRVALARAIAVEPSVLLLDEPLGALDLNLRRQMQEELVGLQKQLGTTFVHVTHDQDEAMSIADIIVVINQGRIEDMGPPEQVYQRPTTRFSATFMGESNVVECGIEKDSDNRVIINSPLGRLPVDAQMNINEKAHVLIRPECLRVEKPACEALEIAKIRVTERVFQGAHVRLRGHCVNSPDQSLLIRTDMTTTLREGDETMIYVKSHDIVILND
ncbi:MAG: ABC transporter ATP-binding protein [Gammaproteobacteria bacterium]|nr:ABC transporter ATP-binding protein [Gammaproteobacteria bacterium]